LSIIDQFTKFFTNTKRIKFQELRRNLINNDNYVMRNAFKRQHSIHSFVLAGCSRLYTGWTKNWHIFVRFI